MPGPTVADAFIPNKLFAIINEPYQTKAKGQKALDHLIALANDGNPVAQFNVAKFIFQKNKQKEFPLAIDLLKSSAAQGYHRAAHNLAYFYIHGIHGFEENLIEAVWHYYQALTLEPIDDPEGEVAKEAKLNAVLMIPELRTKLGFTGGAEARITDINKGLNYRIGSSEPLTHDLFVRAGEGDPHAFGFIEGLFTAEVERLMAAPPKSAHVVWDPSHADPTLTGDEYFEALARRRAERARADHCFLGPH